MLPEETEATSDREPKHHNQGLQMQLSDERNNSNGCMSRQNLTKKLIKSLEGGSVTTSSGNTTYRIVPVTSYEPLVRHHFKAHQTKPEVTGYVAKSFLSQARPGGFSPE